MPHCNWPLRRSLPVSLLLWLETLGTNQLQLYLTKHRLVRSPIFFDNAGLRDFATELVTPNMTNQDMALVAEIKVGTPPQTLSVLLDSGSSDMWIPSKNCKSCTENSIAQNRFFDAYASSTVEIFEPASSSKYYVLNTIRYGSGAVQGVLVRDTVVFAGITITHQSFLLTEDEHMRMADHVWDGIMGLAMPRLAVDGPPIFTKLMDAGVAPVFTFVPDAEASRAQLHLGEVGYSKYTAPGTLQWLDAAADTFWIVDAYVGVTRRVMRKLLIDTGTSLLLMPPQDMVAVVHGIAPSPMGNRCMIDSKLAMVFCACSDVSKMRPLHLYLGNRRFSLTPDDLFEPANISLGGSFPNEEACGLLVSVTPSERGDVWIVGDVFLRKVVTVFDFINRRVGFGEPVSDEPLHLWGAWSSSRIAMSSSRGTAFMLGIIAVFAFVLVVLSLSMSGHRAGRHWVRTLSQRSHEGLVSNEELVG